MSEDQGRPVTPHRSGGGQRVVVGGGAGRTSLALAAMLAMTAGAGVAGAGFPITARSDDRRYAVWPPRNEPYNSGRRAEKDAIARAKAEAKRQRKAAKRLKTANAEVTGA